MRRRSSNTSVPWSACEKFILLAQEGTDNTFKSFFKACSIRVQSMWMYSFSASTVGLPATLQCKALPLTSWVEIGSHGCGAKEGLSGITTVDKYSVNYTAASRGGAAKDMLVQSTNSH